MNIYIYMRVNLKVLVLSVLCDDLLYAKVWRKLKVEFAKVFFLRKFRASSKI